MYLSELLIIFVQNEKCICPNCKIIFSSNSTKHIFPNCKMVAVYSGGSVCCLLTSGGETISGRMEKLMGWRLLTWPQVAAVCQDQQQITQQTVDKNSIFVLFFLLEKHNKQWRKTQICLSFFYWITKASSQVWALCQDRFSFFSSKRWTPGNKQTWCYHDKPETMGRKKH